MAIAVDARTSGAQSFTTNAKVAGGTSVTWTHTLGTLSNGLILVAGAQDAAAASTGAKWDSGGTNAAMTRKTNATATGNCRPEIWYLKAPAVTGAKSLNVAWSGSHDGAYGGASYSGVDQTTTFNAASPQNNTAASGTSISLSLTTTSGEQAISAMVQDYTGSTASLPTKNAAQTYIAAGQTSSTTIGVGASDQAATTTTTAMSWTIPSNGGLSITGISLLPDAGGVTTNWGAWGVSDVWNRIVQS